MLNDACDGFTLLEVSIVLVIIGLLAGGILVGRDMIEASEIRAQISQIEYYSTAVQTFKLKFNCIPGDCVNATDYGLGGNSALHNGNGDGAVNAPCMASSHNVSYGLNKESDNFFYHLSVANLSAFASQGYQNEGHTVNYTPQTLRQRYPKAKLPQRFESLTFPSYFSSNGVLCGGGGSADTLSGNNGFMIATHGLLAATGNNLFSSSINSNIVRQIDQKTDDGKPRSGNVSVASSAWNLAVHVVQNTDGTNKCSETLSNAYPAVETTCKPVFTNRF